MRGHQGKIPSRQNYVITLDDKEAGGFSLLILLDVWLS